MAQTGGGRWAAAFERLLPARREWDLVVERRRHAVVTAGLLARCMLFGGARVALPGIAEDHDARCHSVRCLRSPLLRSFQLSLVAMLSVTTRPPFCMMRTSGSLPRLPISCTRLARHDLVPSFPPQEGRRLRAGVVPSGAV